MKNHKIFSILTGLFLLFNIHTAYTQNIGDMIDNAHFGVKGFINLASMKANPSHQIDTKILGGIGLFANTEIKDNLYFQPEILLSIQGGKQHTFAPNVNDYEYITDEQITYLLLPLNIQYHFSGLYAEAGIQPGFRISASYTYQILEDGKVTHESKGDISDSISPFDFSINIGGGYHLTEQFSLGVRYSLGLTPLNKNHSHTTLKNSVFQFSVNYTLN